MSEKKAVKTMDADELMNTLLNDFKGVLEEINDLIVEKDVDGVKKVLENVGIIISEKNGIPLNSLEDKYDNVLQELLDQLDGVIEKTEVVKGIDGESGKRYLTNEEVDNRIKELEERRNQVANELEDLKRDDPEEQEVSARLTSERMELTEEIGALKASKTTDSDLSTYTIIDENVKALQDKREELVDEKARNLEEIERLQIPQATSAPKAEIIPSQQIDQDRANELNQLISELNQKVNEIGQKNINDLISELRDEARANSEEFSKLQQAIESLEHDREQAEYTRDNEKGRSVEEATADLEKINDELTRKQKQLEDLVDSLDNDNPNKDSIELLEEFVSNGSVTFSDVVSQLQNEKTKLQQAIESLEHDREQAEYTRDNEKGRSVEEATADLEKINSELTEKQKQLDEVNDKIRKIAFPEYVELASQINQAKRERGDLQNDETIFDQLPDKSLQQDEPSQDNSERIEELQKRNDEIDKQIAELDKQIGDIPGATPGTTKTEAYNVKEEAQRIGQVLFLEREIRNELYDRLKRNELTREDYLDFYTIGKENAEQALKNLKAAHVAIDRDISEVIVDLTSEKTMIEQAKEAEQSGDEQEIIAVYEKIRQKYFGDPNKDDELLQKRREELTNGGMDHEITTIEDANKMKEIFDNFIKEKNATANELIKEEADARDSLQVCNQEIERINQEIVHAKVVGETEEAFKAYLDSIEKGKDIRNKLVDVSMKPPMNQTEEDKELLAKFNEARDRFFAHKTTGKFTYVDKDGKTQTLDDIQTIDTENYPEYKEDLEWLNVHKFKDNLEQMQAFEKTGDPFVFGEKIGREYLEKQKLGEEKAYIDEIYEKKKGYVETFNGIPNYYKLKYENFKTAGSILKQMKPISKDLPPATRAKNGLENVGRFFGIRVPKFKKIDAHGNEVRDVKSGIATLAIDAAVVGAVVGSAVTIGPGLALAAYAARGIVVGGNKIAARRVYKKHKYEIDNNIPTLGGKNANRDSREVARKEYYQEKGNNRFVAWVKAKSDKYFTRRRRKETEQAIADQIKKENTDQCIEAKEEITEDNEIFIRNSQARNDRTLQYLQSAPAYNQMKQMIEAGLKNGKSVEDIKREVAEQAIKVSAINGALNAEKPGLGKERIYGDKDNSLDNQFVREDTEPYAKTEKLNGAAEKGLADGEISGTTASQQAKGLQNRLDRYNKLWTALLTMGIKMGITAAKNGFTKEVTETIEHEAEYETKEVPVEKQVEQAIYEQQEKNVLKEGKSKVSDLVLNKDNGGKVHVDSYGKVDGTGGNIGNDYAGCCIEYTDADGNTIVASLGETGNVLEAASGSSQNHVQYLADGSIEDMSPDELIQWFKDNNPNMEKIIESMGLEDASNTEIFNELGKSGTISFQSSNMEGWTAVAEENWETVSELVQTGTEMVTETSTETVTELVKEAYTETITSQVFSPKKFLAELGRSIAAGLGIGVAGDAHETAQPTWKRRRGTSKEAYGIAEEKAGQKKTKETKEQENTEIQEAEQETAEANYVEQTTKGVQDIVNAKRKTLQAEKERVSQEEEKEKAEAKEKPKEGRFEKFKKRVNDRIDELINEEDAIDGDYEELDDDEWPDLDDDDWPDLDNDDDDRDL